MCLPIRRPCRDPPLERQKFIGAKGQVTAKNVSISANLVTVVADWKSAAYTGPSKFVFAMQANASSSFGSANKLDSARFGPTRPGFGRSLTQKKPPRKCRTATCIC